MLANPAGRKDRNKLKDAGKGAIFKKGKND